MEKNEELLKYVSIIKDIILISMPIVIAYISYHSNQKLRQELFAELDVKMKEKEIKTANEIKKITEELENQKNLSSLNDSKPKIDEFLDENDIIRHRNIANLTLLTNQISNLLVTQKQEIDDLLNLRAMLNKINLPNRNDELYPYEIPILYDYDLMIQNLDNKIRGIENNEK